MVWILSRKVHRVIPGVATPQSGPNRVANRESYNGNLASIWVLRSALCWGPTPTAHIWILSHDRHWSPHLILFGGWLLPYYSNLRPQLGDIVCFSSWVIIQRVPRSTFLIYGHPHFSAPLPSNFEAPKGCLTCSANLATRRPSISPS